MGHRWARTDPTAWSLANLMVRAPAYQHAEMYMYKHGGAIEFLQDRAYLLYIQYNRDSFHQCRRLHPLAMSFFRSIPRRLVLHQGDDDVPPDRWQNRDLIPLPPSGSHLLVYETLCTEIVILTGDQNQAEDDGWTWTLSASGALSS